jgi:uncharacterized protein
MIDRTHIILYVRDQARSTEFYSNVLDRIPELNVPGMTEFQLSETLVLGLMPESGIKNLIGDSLPDPSSANGIPRAEVYLLVDHPDVYHHRAIDHGAKELSALLPRDWGHQAAYCLDPDGHVLAFASVLR